MEEQIAPVGEQKEKYEISFLVKEGDDPEVITPLITTRGGEITERAKHGLKRLAFKINKLDQAELHTFYFTASKDQMIKLERDLNLANVVVRFLIVREVQKPAPAPVRDMVRARAQQEEKAAKGLRPKTAGSTEKTAESKTAAKPKEKVEKIEAKELEDKLKELTQE